jgi:hypothetical protein
MASSVDLQREIDRLVTLVRREQKRRMRTAVYSLWNAGDGVHRLKRSVGPGNWSRSLMACAAKLGMHASSLVDAGRAAKAFGGAQRRELCERFEKAGAELAPSHVIELARVPMRQRSRGIEALLQKSYSVRDLRSYLRGAIL